MTEPPEDPSVSAFSASWPPPESHLSLSLPPTGLPFSAAPSKAYLSSFQLNFDQVFFLIGLVDMGFQSAAIPAVVSVINIRNRIQLLFLSGDTASARLSCNRDTPFSPPDVSDKQTPRFRSPLAFLKSESDPHWKGFPLSYHPIHCGFRKYPQK